MENDAGLLLALAILIDSAPMAEKTILDGTLLDLSGVLAIEKGKEIFYQRDQNENFHPLF